MPKIPHAQLVEAILDAVEASGATGVLLSPMTTLPRVFAIEGSFGQAKLWVYAWTLTPGGRPQLKNEFRIQMTSVDPPLRSNPAGPTILIGYEPNLRMFAGFDIERHRMFTSGSPSIQIDITSIHQALQNGVALHRKENYEIAVGIRPDQFITYVFNAFDLHKYARNSATFRVLTKAASLQRVPEREIETLSVERRRLVQTVSRFSRAANFREQVLNAYGHRCAVTRLQLRLVEAAHLLPVSAEGSADAVNNGIALSPTFHRVFDNALIFLDEDYNMRLNRKKELGLATLNLCGGLDAFKACLGKIHLPADKQQWPDPSLIRRANKLRRINSN